jgi:diguanylate cyclase (GGDEF)-like protein
MEKAMTSRMYARVAAPPRPRLTHRDEPPSPTEHPRGPRATPSGAGDGSAAAIPGGAPAAEPQPQPNSPETRLALLKLLHEQGPRAILYHLAVGAAAVLVLAHHVPERPLITWAVLMVLITLVRLLMLRGGPLPGPAAPADVQGAAAQRLERRYLFGVLLSGSLWGLGFPWLAAPVDLLTQTLYLIFIVAIASGAVAVLAVSRLVYYAFHVALYAPVLATLPWLEPAHQLDLVVTTLGLFLLQPAVAEWNHQRLLRTILVQQENRWLAQRLRRTNAALSTANRALHDLSVRDGLTGLLNRRGFKRALGEALRDAQRKDRPLSLIMLDLDHFKAYNDRYGHPAGDDCLRRVAMAITAVVRHRSDLVARYGGEELTVLLPGTRPSDALALAERIRTAVLDLGIAAGCDGVRGENRLSVSAGVAGLIPGGLPDGPIDSIDLTIRGSTELADASAELIGRADRALYQAKAGGRNRVVYGDGDE